MKFFELTDDLKEIYSLTLDRIRDIRDEKILPEAFQKYFNTIADYLLLVNDVYMMQTAGKLKALSFEEGKSLNQRLYGRFQEENYSSSFLNPAFATDKLGSVLGPELSFVYADLTALTSYAYEGRLDLMTDFMGLFTEIYVMLSDEAKERIGEDAAAAAFSEDSITYLKKSLDDVLYYFYHDYSEILGRDNIMTYVNPEYDFFTDIVMNSNLSDLSYLYRYGHFISDNEIKLAEYMNSRSEEEIQSMADTFTEGFRIGFITTERDLSIKKTVQIVFPIGLERVVRASVINFEKMGLKSLMKRESVLSFTGRPTDKNHVYSTSANPQFDFDHKDDKGFYLRKGYVERLLEVSKETYESEKKNAKLLAGPAVIEMFGEKDFTPVNKTEAYHYTDEQNELNVYSMSKMGQLVNNYIPGEERSFTIISYPYPSIGDNFEEIFTQTIKINTLDYKLYQTMQQKLIDVLDRGEYVKVKGSGDNYTDITVALHPISDKDKETKFENCVADVNIPVGEVFTSPVLKGTNGVLYVSQVYLNGLSFKNLELTFEDGCVKEYSCTNFETEEENKKYIYDNILFHHETLPIGEFAIGTNTTAYKMGIELDIQDKLPILIAEKTGPHFAVGDTCYSHSEDVPMHNPDGKECIARSNDFADLRDTDPEKAYFNCHTDITIPYNELDTITAYDADGTAYPVIAGGRFVVAGTEELNLPLDELNQ